MPDTKHTIAEKERAIELINGVIGPTDPVDGRRKFTRLSQDRETLVYFTFSQKAQLFYDVKPNDLVRWQQTSRSYAVFVMGTHSELLIIPAEKLAELISGLSPAHDGNIKLHIVRSPSDGKFSFREISPGDVTGYHNAFEQLRSENAALLQSVIQASPPDSAALPTVNYLARGSSKTKGIEYGAPINFRGLRHAPINEQGVIYLFGMVSNELGFLVEAIHASYPDCEAKRCIDNQRGRWAKISIEFEYRSSNFKQHGHDPTGCDVIVCWEHDWLDCPLEVIELQWVIKGLEGSGTRPASVR